MSRKKTHLLPRLLALALTLALLAGCGAPRSQEGTMSPEDDIYALPMDENGVVHWDAVEGAVEYEYAFVDAQNTNEGFHTTTELSVQVPRGYCLHMAPIMANGEKGDILISPYFDTPAAGGENPAPEENFLDPDIYVDGAFDVKWEDLTAWSLLPSIRWDTLETLPDGSVSFEADSPGGSTVRFVATGVTLTEDSITFAPGSFLTSLDSIGRICAISHTVKDLGDEDNWLYFRDGYTFTDKTRVDSPEELYFLWGSYTQVRGNGTAEPQKTSRLDVQPNFLHLGGAERNLTAFTLSDLTVYYDEATFATPLQTAVLDYELYGSYMEGETYDPSKERYDMTKEIYDFALMFVPEAANAREPLDNDMDPVVAASRSVQSLATDDYTIGNLKDANGNVLDRYNATLDVGSTLEITLGNYTLDMTLPVLERYSGAQTLHQLTPYDNATAQGAVTALVVPIYWQDQPENATDAALSEIYASLGRVTDVQGNVTDYSGNLSGRFSLSGYYDTASYGQHSITSFVTDWYAAPYNYLGEKDSQGVLEDYPFREELYEWVKATYPDLDWSKFDADGDGFLDAVILINVGDSGDELNMMSYSYALHISTGYTGVGAGTQDSPAMKNFVSVNSSLLEGNALIHEYAHGFGLVDYYDVTYSGADAVGGYDMQSGSTGDWNAYSKYAVGWLQPQVITDLAPGESTEVTIGALSAQGDALVIPAAGSDFDGPFGEYILIDLLTGGGTNRYDASANGLGGVAGVRISHVNSDMEKRTLTGDDGVDYTIGTIHVANTYNEQGKYLLEVIQSGKVNTFTDLTQLRTQLSREDLFYAGDVFRVEDYTQFFQNGRMDDGSEFGYTVTVVRVSSDSATLRITRQ